MDVFVEILLQVANPFREDPSFRPVPRAVTKQPQWRIASVDGAVVLGHQVRHGISSYDPHRMRNLERQCNYASLILVNALFLGFPARTDDGALLCSWVRNLRVRTRQKYGNCTLREIHVNSSKPVIE
ncbi:hypothetical protein PR202_ga18565 [Eleusine coracana subsp. coracana]|uniref:Uncharacterized protein n=1 Tax=Eleusine coracana subsp. coracana TaxID=191504 RepID=A0AAV5CT60_ELECO|nr:hypothetical protein PR202_ga18565 [Eleusine coracana subsp. coracana]